MGLLYDVYYPRGNMLDMQVSDLHLDRIAADPDCDGAIAHCVNGDGHTLVLCGGEWIDPPEESEARPKTIHEMTRREFRSYCRTGKR